MSHRADKKFFATKRSWSERKDLILDYYLRPYLAKISRLKRPILLVDGFAGPGIFDDGQPGSPLILAKHATEARRRANTPPISLVCIEADTEFFGRLQENTGHLEIVQTWYGEFLQFVPQIRKLASSHSTFLYLDPFTVKELEWRSLETLFRGLEQGQSVEVLLNFNTPIFVRSGLAALKGRSVAQAENDSGTLQEASIETLNGVVGGEWWQDVLRKEKGFERQIQAIIDNVASRLHEWFPEVCRHMVLALPHHTIPKYHLVFGSRHPSALRLMNDAMRKSLERLAASAKSGQPTLFEMRPTRLVPDRKELERRVLAIVKGPIARGVLIETVMREREGIFSETEIRQAVTRLIQKGQLKSETGRTRINDQALVLPGSKKL